MAKDNAVVTKQFIFDIAENNDATIELIQLISVAIQTYELTNVHAHPADIPTAIKFFWSLYGLKS